MIHTRSIEHEGLAVRLAGALLAFAVLTASSHVAVPLGPVPMTMQTLAVTLTGVLLGPRIGASVVAAWVLCGFSGAPVFALGNGGLAAMTGPTAGYLYAFPLVAAFTGWAAAQGGFIRTLLAMLAGNALCLVLGGAWLAVGMGLEKAVMVGVAPFVLGGVLKSVLGAAILKALDQARH